MNKIYLNDSKYRRYFILHVLRQYDNAFSITFGIGVLVIKNWFTAFTKKYLSDADFKYLIDKGFIEAVISGIKPTLIYYHVLNSYSVRITARGVDYLEQLEEEGNKKSKEAPVAIQQNISAINANVTGYGNVQATVDIHISFNEAYAQIAKNKELKPAEKEELAKEVGELEGNIKNNKIEKVKEVFLRLKEKSEFLYPILAPVISEWLKKWFGL